MSWETLTGFVGLIVTIAYLGAGLDRREFLNLDVAASSRHWGCITFLLALIPIMILAKFLGAL